MTENEILQGALKKVEAQQENFGFMDRFNVDEHWAVRKALEEIPRYRDLGTVDELTEMQVQYNHLLHEVKKYRAIGTVEEFRILKEKAEPKKPISIDGWGEYWKCPTCGKYAVDNLGCKYKYCRECGTKFDWS